MEIKSFNLTTGIRGIQHTNLSLMAVDGAKLYEEQNCMIKIM